VSPRTPEEREAARREREIKRLRKAGEPIPPELLQPVQPPPPVVPPTPTPAPEPARPAEPAPEPYVPPRAAEPEPPAYDPPTHEPAPAYEPPTPEPAPAAYEPPAPEPAPAAYEPPAREPEPPAPEPTRVHEPAPEAPHAHEPAPEPAPYVPREPRPYDPVEATRQITGEHDAARGDQPSGEWHFDTGEHEVEPARRMPRFGGRGRGGDGDGPRPPKAGRHRHRRGPIVLAVVGLVVVLAVGWFVNALFEPFAGDGEGTCKTRIEEGASTADIGDTLAKDGVVSSAFFFQIRAQLDGANLRSGTYTLPCGISYSAALEALSKAPKPAKTISVVIPEGLSRKEIAPRVKKEGVSGDYVKASVRSKKLTPQAWGAPKSAKTLEGFLFPATYELKQGADATELVDEQLATFKDRIKTVDMTYAKRKKLTVYDVLIVASMVDREAAVAGDRRKIAEVIYNRLKDKIPLGIDATTRYQYGDWEHPITQSQLESDSPYNTRKNLGLPPTPIGNPGLAAIKAAANPTRAGYLYFVVKPCGKGAHTFSKTYAQFQQDEAAYNAAREKNGGKDPSTC
jgi:UPF0755 protein